MTAADPMMAPAIAAHLALQAAVDVPAIWQIWLAALIVGGAGYVLAMQRPLLVLLVLPVALVVDWYFIHELIDPSLSPAIHAAKGQAYLVQTYLAAGAALVLPLAGLVAGRTRRNQQPRSSGSWTSL